MKDRLEIKGEVEIHLGDLSFIFENTFQDLARNYLRNALINTGSFIPISSMAAYYSTGSTTISVSKSAIGTGQCRIEGSFPLSLEMKNIYELDLLSSSGVYSKVSIPHYTKKANDDFIVVWKIRIL